MGEISYKHSKTEILHRVAEFCSQTSLHGWQYIQSENGVIRKLVWISLIIGHYVLAGYLIWENYTEYSTSTILTTIHSTTSSLDDIKFPSVYACNLNQVTKSFLYEIGIEEINGFEQQLLLKEFKWGSDSDQELNAHDLDSVNRMIQNMIEVYGYNHSQDHLSFYAGQECWNMFLKAKWSNYSYEYFYVSYYDYTDYGSCCFISPYIDFVNPWLEWHEIPSGYASNGLQNGLMITMDLEHFDHAVPWDSMGFKIGLSDPLDKIIMRNTGFNVQPGALTEVAIIPTIMNTTEAAIDKFDPKVRNCYTPDEVQLEYFPPLSYSMQNCLYEAVFQKVLEKCHCISHVKYDLVKKKNPELSICKGSKQLSCEKSFLNNLGDDKLGMNYILDENGNEQQCLQKCEVQQDNKVLSQLLYPHVQTFHHHDDFCLILEKMAMICNITSKRAVFEKYYQGQMDCNELEVFRQRNNESCIGNLLKKPLVQHEDNPKFIQFLHNYASENVAKIAVYLRDPYYTSITKDVKISFIDFVSNIGGQMGLCLGFSFFTIFELVYHLMKCIFGMK